MQYLYSLDACIDCIAFVANGDVPEDRPTLAQEITDHLRLKDGEHIVNDGDDEDWFSWSACECCGSPLGGHRNRLAVLGPS